MKPEIMIDVSGFIFKIKHSVIRDAYILFNKGEDINL